PSPGPVRNAPGGPNSSYGPPEVNPFAATASPASRKVNPAPAPQAPPAPPASAYGPPPVPPQEMTPAPHAKQPSAPPGVSPLAVSNALSQRGAFEQIAGAQMSAVAATALPPTAASGGQPAPTPATPKDPGSAPVASQAAPPQGAQAQPAPAAK